MALDPQKVGAFITDSVKAGFSDEEIHAALSQMAHEDQQNTPERKARIEREMAIGQDKPRSFLDKIKDAASGVNLRDFNGLMGELNDGLTFGQWHKATDAMGTTNQAERERIAKEYPAGSQVMRGTGMGLSAVAGPMAALDNVVVRGAEAAAPMVAKTLVGRGATGAITGGTAAYTETGDPVAAAKGMVTGAAVPLAAAGAGKVIEGVGDAASGVRGLLYKAVPWLQRYRAAREAGLYGNARFPVAEIPATGRPGIQDQAEKSLGKIVDRADQKLGAAGGEWTNTFNAEKGKPADLEPMVDELYSLQKKSEYSGGDVMSDRRSHYEAANRAFDDLARLHPNRTVGDLVSSRQASAEASGFGAENPTEAQLASRDIYFAKRATVRKSSPNMGKGDDKFKNAKREHARTGDLTFNRESGPRWADMPDAELEGATPPSMAETKNLVAKDAQAKPEALRVPDEDRGTMRIKRIGDETEEGLRAKKHLAELGAQDPVYQQALDELQAKKALEGNRFAIQPALQENLTGAFLKRLGPISGQNLRATARVLDEGTKLGRFKFRGLQGLEANSKAALELPDMKIGQGDRTIGQVTRPLFMLKLREAAKAYPEYQRRKDAEEKANKGAQP